MTVKWIPGAGIVVGTSAYSRWSPAFGIIQETNYQAVNTDIALIFSVGSQRVYPVSTQTNSGWVPVGAATIHETLDELVPDDSDYSYTLSSGSTFKVKLGAISSPEDGDVTVTYRIRSYTGSQITVRLVEGTTIIASWVHTGSNTPQQFSRVLTAPQRASITDWTNLYFEGESQ